MIFRQITHADLGCPSYLVGDEKAGVAAGEDPRFEGQEDPARARPRVEGGESPELAGYRAVRTEPVFETHNHADHVSGHGRLAAATGATIHVSADAEGAYDPEPLHDRDRIQVGG